MGGGDATGTVIDTGSDWITDGLTVGNDESEFNQLVITNGGAVYVRGSSAVIDQFSGGSNQVVVSGNGALLDASPVTSTSACSVSSVTVWTSAREAPCSQAT